MPLFIQGLMKSLSGCSPEARFFLEVVSGRASRGDHADGAFRVKPLARQLCIPEGDVSSAFAELVSAGVIERLASAPLGRGRPTISYQLSPSTLMALEAQPHSYGLHSAHLERLFSGADIQTEIPGRRPKIQKERAAVTKDKRPAPPGARSRLSICNRLLLGVLLANADQFGVVKVLTSKDLRLLTGFDAESLKRRLQRLVGVGLIRSIVPGVTSSIFRARRINSTYFLNLNHPGYGLSGVSAVLVHWLPPSKVQNDAFGVLWRDVLGFRRSSPLNSPETPKAVLHLLAPERRPVFDVLRLMLYRYASELLSRHWFDLVRDDEGDYGWLRDRIEADLQSPAGYGGGDVERDRAWEEILSHLCKLVEEIAQVYRVRFGAANWIGFDSVQLCILPVLQGEGDEVISLLLQPRPIEVSICTILRESTRGDLIPEEWGIEADISMDYRFYCGLLTPPTKRLLRR